MAAIAGGPLQITLAVDPSGLIATSQADRRALLANVVDRAPLPTVAAAETSWTTPRDIDSLEWFASANDICHVYASLAALARRPGLSPVASGPGTATSSPFSPRTRPPP